MYLVLFEIFSLGPFFFKGRNSQVIAQLWNLNHMTWLYSDRPMWEMIWKIFFTFDFHILP